MHAHSVEMSAVMETVLNKIERNTSSLTTAYLVCSGRGSRYRTHFDEALVLDTDSRFGIALQSFISYFATPNIDAGINNTLHIFDPSIQDWTTLTLETGSYSLRDINDAIQEALPQGQRGSVTISASYVTLKSSIAIKHGWKVRFTGERSDLGNILGFEPTVGELIEGTHKSDNIVNIFAINTISISVDIAQGAYVDGQRRNIIYSFFPTCQLGTKIVERPVNLIYLPIMVNRIESVEISILDQTGTPINLRDETVTCSFEIRRI